MGHLNYNLEKVAGYVRAANKLVAPSVSKMSFKQRLKPALMDAAIRANQKLLNYSAMGLDPMIMSQVAPVIAGTRLAGKLGSKAMNWLKSKIKPQSKSIDLSSDDVSWLDTPDMRAQLSTAPKFKIPL